MEPTRGRVDAKTRLDTTADGLDREVQVRQVQRHYRSVLLRWPTLTALAPQPDGGFMATCELPGCPACVRYTPVQDLPYGPATLAQSITQRDLRDAPFFVTHTRHSHADDHDDRATYPGRAALRAQVASAAVLNPILPPARLHHTNGSAVPADPLSVPQGSAPQRPECPLRRVLLLAHGYRRKLAKGPAGRVFGTVRGDWDLDKVSSLDNGGLLARCTVPGCGALLLVEPAAHSQDDVYVTHDQHHHHNKHGAAVAIRQLNRDGCTARDDALAAAWAAWDASPSYQPIAGPPLPLNKDACVEHITVTPQGLLQGVDYDTADTRPLQPDLIEVADPAAAIKQLRAIGYADLRSDERVRVFEIDEAKAKGHTWRSLTDFSGIANLNVDPQGNVTRPQRGRRDEVQAQMTDWYSKYEGLESTCRLRELGGQHALVLGTRNQGRERVPLMACGQARNAAAMRNLVLKTCQLLTDCGAWAPIDAHFDGSFELAGNASPACVQHTAIAYVNMNNYAAQAPFYPAQVQEALDDLAQAIWDMYVEGAPWLEAYRRNFLSDAGQAACLRLTATNLLSKTENCAVSIHLDTKDGLFSGLLWVNDVDPRRAASAGEKHELVGGAFIQPGLGTQYTAFDMSWMVLAGGLVAHGTRPLVSRGGARRLGFSLFLRVPAMERVAIMQAAAGGPNALLQAQWAYQRQVLAATPGVQRKRAITRVFNWREGLMGHPPPGQEPKRPKKHKTARKGAQDPAAAASPAPSPAPAAATAPAPTAAAAPAPTGAPAEPAQPAAGPAEVSGFRNPAIRTWPRDTLLALWSPWMGS